jgi:NADH:ubiquinone oxidoreductase subunit 6 (subunit J)
VVDTFIEYYVRFIALTVTSYWGAILWITIGVYGIVTNYKKRHNEEELRSYWYYAGWLGSIMFLIIGMSIIALKTLNKI